MFACPSNANVSGLGVTAGETAIFRGKEMGAIRYFCREISFHIFAAAASAVAVCAFLTALLLLFGG